MKHPFIFWTLRRTQYAALGLIAAVALSSCAPALISAPATSTVTASAVVAAPETATPADLSAPATLAATVTVSPTQVVEVQAVPTSRGPNLEATDPTTVNLASGQLQLVEFFRFT